MYPTAKPARRPTLAAAVLTVLAASLALALFAGGGVGPTVVLARASAWFWLMLAPGLVLDRLAAR